MGRSGEQGPHGTSLRVDMAPQALGAGVKDVAPRGVQTTMLWVNASKTPPASQCLGKGS